MKYTLAVLFVLAFSFNAMTADELEPGLTGEYYNIGVEVPDFPTLAADAKPATKKIDKEINFESTDTDFNGTMLVDQFYVRWTGVLKVAKEGKYTLFTESDDGSRVFVDGKQVVDNNGLHAMEEKSGEVDLKAGDHELKVEFFENGGGAGCKFSWQGPDIAKEIVPGKVLFHKKDAPKVDAPKVDAPKAPEVKAPDAPKAPEVKAPDAPKAPEVK